MNKIKTNKKTNLKQNNACDENPERAAFDLFIYFCPVEGASKGFVLLFIL